MGILLPCSCPGCGSVGVAPCRGCVARLSPPPALAPPPHVDRSVALFAYEGVGARLVQQLKYANHRDALDPLAWALAELVRDDDHDAVCWVPTLPRRARRRGFDQAELLARAVAAHLGRPARSPLVRIGRAPQTGSGRLDRLHGVRIRARGPCPAHVLVVDDVRTTGASLAAAAEALREAGATSVVAATLAATPFRARADASTIEPIS